MAQTSTSPPWFVCKDLDGFFGLMIDNLIQLILIVSLCRELIRLPDEYIFGKILPGAAISILLGNFFYAWQARQDVARQVNSALVMLYWRVGQPIRRDVLKEKRAEYGEEIVATLSQQLTKEYGSG